MSAQEVESGLWHWRAPHPQWRARDWWPQLVSSYAVDDGTRLLLVDPLSPPAEIDDLMAHRQTLVVLTCPWHERSSQALVAEKGLEVWSPPADRGSPDIAWLNTGADGPGHLYTLQGGIPEGIAVLPGQRPNDLVLRIASCDAVVFGDTLVEYGHGLEVNTRWLPQGASSQDVARQLGGILEPPPRHLLATHGGPQTLAAVQRALGAPH